MTDEQYKEKIEQALRKWLAGDPSTTNLINAILVVVKEAAVAASQDSAPKTVAQGTNP